MGELYSAAHDRLVKVSRTAIAAGVEKQRVRPVEQQAALISDVLRRSLSDLGVRPDDPRVGPVVARHLRAMAALPSGEGGGQ